VKYLLDINVLIALAHTSHSLHGKALSWYSSILSTAEVFHTCSITELGFVRVCAATGLQADVAAAKHALIKLKSSSQVPFVRLTDALGVETLPAFVKNSRMITDGHLAALASRNNAKLITLDAKIPGSVFIG
jgi:predicted nucleic acid-binding protein